MKNFKIFKISDDGAEETLQPFVAALRDERSEDSLSDGARERILHAAVTHADDPGRQGFAPLFLTRQRLGLAAAMPVVLLALLGGYVARQPLEAPGPERSLPPQLHVSKQDGDIVIRVADGDTARRVRRTTDRKDAGGQAVEIGGGAFREALGSEGDLVFYRIE